MKTLRINEVREATGLSRTTIWRLERQPNGDFPKRLRLGPNSVGWSADEIKDWLESRPRGLAA